MSHGCLYFYDQPLVWNLLLWNFLNYPQTHFRGKNLCVSVDKVEHAFNPSIQGTEFEVNLIDYSRLARAT